MSSKWSKTHKLSPSNKSLISRSRARNRSIAVKRGVNYVESGVRSATRRKNKTTSKRVQLKFNDTSTKLKLLNKQLRLALKLYRRNIVSKNSEGPLMDAVSGLLVDITSNMQDAVEGGDASLFVEFAEEDLDVDEPYDYVDGLTEYINDEIIYASQNANSRRERARVVVALLESAIQNKASELNEAIASKKSNQLAMAIDDMIDTVGVAMNNNL